MKYSINCKVFNIVFSKMLKSFYKENYPEVNVKSFIKDVKKEYKEMILRTPGLSKDNKMAGNLQGAAYFFAMAKKIPDMTPEFMDEIINKSFESDFMKKIHKGKKEKGTIFTEKEQDKMYKDSLRSQNSDDEMDWRYTYQKGDGEIFYTITKCGVCRLAEREHCLEYLPSMCKMDFPKYKLVGATLIRTKTLANKNECCDFHLTRDK